MARSQPNLDRKNKGVRRHRLSRTSFRFTRRISQLALTGKKRPARADTRLEVEDLSSIHRSGSVPKEPLNIKRWGTTVPQTPPLEGTSPASLTTHHVATKINFYAHLLDTFHTG